jgi:hypothetical protein
MYVCVCGVVSSACPLDIKEAVCSVCYATPFLENSPELVKLRHMFLNKYGAQFPAECVQACCVNQKMISILSRPVPSEALINFYLSWIANKHQIDWEAPVPSPPSFVIVESFSFVVYVMIDDCIVSALTKTECNTRHGFIASS